MRIIKWISLGLLALFYVVAGANHFRAPDFYVAIMPPYLPLQLELVYLSGVAEIVLGLAVLVPRLRRLAAWGIILLLIAVFPANIHVAVNDVGGLGIASWIRLPIQALFIAWAWWHTRPDPEAAA